MTEAGKGWMPVLYSGDSSVTKNALLHPSLSLGDTRNCLRFVAHRRAVLGWRATLEVP
jgi:hypothetical protein